MGKDGSWNPAHYKVYSIQHYVMQIVNDLRQVSTFLQGLRFFPPIKLNPHDKKKILLKVTTTHYLDNIASLKGEFR
jgi:hypothetical protein